MKALFRNMFFITTSALLVFHFGGCTVPREAEEEAEGEAPGERVMMKKDTAEVKVVPPGVPETEKGWTPSTPSTAMVYAVQIGAFENSENASRVEQMAKTRFTQAVRRHYDQITRLYKVSVGSFATKDQALEFRKIINERYPGEYNDAWIVEIPK